jgi:hypothetical protein
VSKHLVLGVEEMSDHFPPAFFLSNLNARNLGKNCPSLDFVGLVRCQAAAIPGDFAEMNVWYSANPRDFLHQVGGQATAMEATSCPRFAVLSFHCLLAAAVRRDWWLDVEPGR